MLVHLKPKKQQKKSEVMKNYADKTNWNYRVNNPIHCKNSLNISIKQLLTQKVSTHGKSLSPPSKQLNFQSPKIKNRVRQNNSRLLAQQNKKTVEHQQKSPVIELSSLYKKSFKYNTTIHQILKNYTKKSQNKNTGKPRHLNMNFTYYNKQSIKSEPNIHIPFQKQEIQDKQCLSQRLKKLQQIKNQCSELENVQQKDSSKCCHINQLKFSEEQNKPQVMKVSLFQWRTNKPHLTKLKWKKDSRLKRNLKNNLTTASNIDKNYYNSNDNENYLDSMFYPTSYDNGIFKTYNSNTISSCRDQTQGEKDYLQIYYTNRKTSSQIIPDKQLIKQKLNRKQQVFKVARDNQFSHRAQNPFEYPVDGWNTKDKDDFQLFHHVIQE